MLSPYLDGALDAAERETVQAHLASCPACMKEWEELNLSVSMLQELPEIAPPAGFRVGLMEKIDQLSVAQTQDKRWFNRVAGITGKTWYRTAAVAAVMAMTLGLASLWEKDGKQFIPIDPKTHQDVAVVVPGDKDKSRQVNQDNTQPDSSQKEQPAKPNGGTSGSEEQKPAQTQSGQSSSVNTPKQGEDRKTVENFVPQKSEGLLARSVSLKLDVQDLITALKAVGSITQNNHGSLEVPYEEKDGTGTVAVRIPAAAADEAVNELQQLGVVVSRVPVNQDLSVRHKQARESIEQLMAKKQELESKLAGEDNAELQKQLSAVNANLADQVNLIKQLETRSTYTIISITLI